MGLLDMISGDAPMSQQQRLGLLMLAAASPKAGGVAFGSGLLDAVKGAQDWQSSDEDRKSKRELQAAQMQEYQAQAQQRQAQAQQLQAAAAEQQRQRALLAGAFGGTKPIDANAASGVAGPRPEALAVVGQSQAPNYQQLIANGLDPKLVEQLAAARNWGRDKVARTVKGMGPDGKEYEYQVDEFGQRVGDGLAQYRAPIQVDQGNKKTFVDAYNLKPMASMQTFQDPNSAASTGLGYARLAFDKSKDAREQAAPKGQYDAERGVMIDPRTNIATPVMLGGKPLAPKDKPLTESQGNAAALGMRAQHALNALDKVDTVTNGDYYKSKMPWGTGNFMMSAAGQQSMNAEKQFIAAVLRKESGAAISTGEYQEYGDQFFPRPGDKPEKLAQKAQNRAIALAGLKIQAGPSGQAQADSFMETIPKSPAQRNITVDY